MNYHAVLTKRDFVKRFNEGEFGNRGKTWNTFEEWIDETEFSAGAKYHLRNRIAGGPTYYDLSATEITLNWGKSNNSQWYVSEMAPSEKTLLQGEVMQSPEGFYLYYNQQPTNMREGFKLQQVHAYNTYASQLLQKYMDPMSWDWVNVLLERYPGHVIEFSVYSTCWGTIPNRNTVVWEVRKY